RDAEAQRLASEQRFRATFDSATQFVGILQPDGKVVEINRTALDFVGRPASAVLGAAFSETDWWTERPEAQSELKRAIDRAARGELVRYLTTNRGREGQLATVDFSLKPLFDAGGKVVQLLAEWRDITESEKARIALEESEERFRAAMEYAAIGIALVSLDGRFLKVNRALCEIVGYSEADLLARSFQDLTHPHDLDADLAQAKELLAGRISHYHMEKRYIHRRGHVVWVLLSGSIVRSASGEPRVFVAEIQDITARKAHEDQLRASVTEKEVLLREIHHRVKNNLQVISSILRLQAAQAESPELRDKFEDAQARIHAMALIHDRLYQSQNLASIDFGAHLRDLSSMLVRFFGRAEQAVRLELALEPVRLELDTAIPLGLVANELITNALKHAFQGRGEGTVSVALASGESELTLTVADNGVGFPAGFSLESGKSLGMRLVTSLAHQLRGRLVLERTE
ncbi:MAG: PAS domain S-box protein, partial [Polyangiaceae bacterium]|nr:PAS domain S-box protein [Polyangiaceae bacterium]